MAAQYGAHALGRRSSRSCARRGSGARSGRSSALAEEKLAFFGQRLMGYRWDQPAYSLSYANRRRLEIARAMATEPRMLLLDEPAAGMNPVETHEITELIGAAARARAATRSSSSSTTCTSSRASPTASSRSTTASRSPRARSSRSRPTPRVVEAYLGPARRRRRSERALLELDDVDTYYGQIHILESLEPARRRGRARVPARRQRVGQVDDAEDDPRHRAAAHGRRAVRGRGRDRRARRAIASRSGMAIVPGEPAPVRADDACSRTSRWARTSTAAARRRTSSACTRSSRCCYERRSQLAGTLSGGEQQMVAMGRALMSRPKLLLMDEPSMGLAPILVERSFEIIKEVHEAGVAILVVEQNANVSLSIADRGYVLSTGRVVLEGKAQTCCRTRTRRHTLAVKPCPTRHPGTR